MLLFGISFFDWWRREGMPINTFDASISLHVTPLFAERGAHIEMPPDFVKS